WIRPISGRINPAISERDMLYQNGQPARLLDIITIPMIEPRPRNHQTENHLIASDYYWEKQGDATWQQIVDATDKRAGTIWSNEDSSYHGLRDKVPEAVANELQSSLMLIEPTRLDLVVGSESLYRGGSVRKVRAQFAFNGADYNFVVTDPWIETRYFAEEDG